MKMISDIKHETSPKSVSSGHKKQNMLNDSLDQSGLLEWEVVIVVDCFFTNARQVNQVKKKFVIIYFCISSPYTEWWAWPWMMNSATYCYKVSSRVNHKSTVYYILHVNYYHVIMWYRYPQNQKIRIFLRKTTCCRSVCPVWTLPVKNYN